jgi:hypothetical protein
MHYASIVAMVAMLIAAVSYAYWKMKPASADDIYQDVILAVESEDENQLLAVRPLISEFLTRFPHDMRREELKAIDDDAELARVMRTLQRRLATLEGANELSLLEQSFLDAMQTRSRDANAGRQKLSAFLRVFGQLDRSQLKNARLIELAEFALNAKPRKPTHPQASEELAQLLTEAEKNLRPAELKEFFRSLEVLYANKPWAADQLARIRQRFPTDATPATINPAPSSAAPSSAAEAEKP